jgi:hypothetical protein
MAAVLTLAGGVGAYYFFHRTRYASNISCAPMSISATSCMPQIQLESLR